MMATIGKLFGKSPFGPLQEHMVIVKECVDYIIPFFEAVINKDKKSVKEIAEKIFVLEDKADDIKNDLRDQIEDLDFCVCFFPRDDMHQRLILVEWIGVRLEESRESFPGAGIGRRRLEIGEPRLEFRRARSRRAGVNRRGEIFPNWTLFRLG